MEGHPTTRDAILHPRCGPRRLQQQRETHRPREADQVQPALAWQPPQEEHDAQALRRAAHGRRDCDPEEEVISGDDGARGDVVALVLA